MTSSRRRQRSTYRRMYHPSGQKEKKRAETKLCGNNHQLPAMIVTIAQQRMKQCVLLPPPDRRSYAVLVRFRRSKNKLKNNWSSHILRSLVFSLSPEWSGYRSRERKWYSLSCYFFINVKRRGDNCGGDGRVPSGSDPSRRHDEMYPISA